MNIFPSHSLAIHSIPSPFNRKISFCTFAHLHILRLKFLQNTKEVPLHYDMAAEPEE